MKTAFPTQEAIQSASHTEILTLPLKFEPADLGAVRVPEIQEREDAAGVLAAATALLLSGQEVEASAMADAWVASIGTEKQVTPSNKAVA
ncbi:hypothetical protein [Denitromonas iodatirespirans]|uniref:Uncharacterized protein n=1 Tax=Denitromonas iodatirespirans TaxID=2795389 RepID=A0A944DAS5_DENI1|nr:hypothetical protein [Denitromonas iodatirespirans]MBT0963330.1 hypothetical protein [Denitromonas iodatirespirans]